MDDKNPIVIPDRQLARLGGTDAISLLQKLATQDLAFLTDNDGIAYSLLLSPQGRYLFDFFVMRRDGQLWLDMPAAQANALIETLNRYKLRADTSIDPVAEQQVYLAAAGDETLRDPRHPELGYRLWGDLLPEAAGNYMEKRIALGIVEPSIDMQSGVDLPLDFDLDKLNAISFTKGCFPGQELTARTHHRQKARYTIVNLPLDEVGNNRIIAQVSNRTLVQVRRDSAN